MNDYLEYSTPSLLHADRRQVASAVAALTLCCVLWGFSFPVMQLATHALEAAVRRETSAELSEREILAIRGGFNGLRFGWAAILYVMLTRARPRSYTNTDVLAGSLVGVCFTVGMLFQVTGLRYALPSVSSFLTALAVIFAPLGQLVLFRKRVGGATWLAVALATGGILILAQSNAGAAAENTLAHRPPVRNLGEILTVLGAVLFTGQILTLSGPLGRRADPVRLTTVMLLLTGVLNLVAGCLLTERSAVAWPRLLNTLLHDRTFLLSTGSLVVFSTLLALHLMNAYQPRVSGAAASVIYCLEPVFGTLWSVGFRTEQLTRVTVVGGAVILAAVLVVAWPPSARGNRKRLASEVAK